MALRPRLLALSVLILGLPHCAAPPSARVLGATETVRVVEADLDFLAIVDTGAYRTSLHALDLAIEDPAADMRRNVGKRITFLVTNEEGRSRRVESVISAAEPVRTSHGTEWRYVVPLHLRYGAVEKQVHVNLRDRTPMTFKLLVGRDWIRGFLVDVERNPVE